MALFAATARGTGKKDKMNGCPVGEQIERPTATWLFENRRGLVFHPGTH